MTLDHVRCAMILIFSAGICYAAPVLASEKPTAVTTVVIPEGSSSPVALREMTLEAEHILKQSGIVLRWHFGHSSEVVSGLLVVVKLLGQCDMDGPTTNATGGALGWTYQTNGVLLPFSDLACDNIRGSVRTAMLASNQLRRNVMLGRAMGRVLAHELYHIVADTSDHGQRGVGQAALSAHDLTSGRLELDQPEVDAMQSGLGRGR